VRLTFSRVGEESGIGRLAVDLRLQEEHITMATSMKAVAKTAKTTATVEGMRFVPTRDGGKLGYDH
jgi:hypothetical protein